MDQESIARKTFELENEVEEEILTFNDALIKIVNHAKQGGDLEIMGLM